MKTFQIFSGLLMIFVQLPIWLYLLYTLLAAVHPDRLMWFLFWVYVPSDFVVVMVRAIGQTIAENEVKKIKLDQVAKLRQEREGRS